MNRLRPLLLLLLLSPCIAQAQTAPAVPVTLGHSVVALYGPWKFHVGDNPQWADPGFDDSHWETVDLTPTPQTTLPGVPIPGFVSGWSARGHPGYAGFAWYRIRVRIDGASGPLALLAPEWYDGEFQVFSNGRLAASVGDFSGPVPKPRSYPNPTLFRLAASEFRPGADGTTLLAFRFYMAPAMLEHRGTGGMHGPPRLGLPGAATAILHMEWERSIRRIASSLAAALLYFLVALLIAMMLAFNRADKILLWPLSACVLETIHFGLIFSTNLRWMSEAHLAALINFAGATGWFVWLLTWLVYFRLRHKRWLFNAIVALGICDLAVSEFFTLVPQAGAWHGLMAAMRVENFAIYAAVFLAIATIAYLGWKRADRAQWPLFLALFFYSFLVFAPAMQLLHLRTAWQPFGVLLPLELFSDCTALFFFSIVLFRQFRASQRRQQAVLEDVKQAQEVQQVLIPKQLPRVPGLAIESEYRPAREVGGDFFHIQPADDGSLLIICGDVSGKGLKAAMTVSTIIGALRNEPSRQPATVLANLNRLLHGNISGFAVCTAALIHADGSMTLANAGNLAPYLNGKELPVEPGLPLGVTAESAYAESALQLNPSDRLAFISDGVVEATNPRRELFGFDRTQAISNQTAGAIADAARRWGQEDDITVLTVTRAPKLEAVPA